MKGLIRVPAWVSSASGVGDPFFLEISKEHTEGKPLTLHFRAVSPITPLLQISDYGILLQLCFHLACCPDVIPANVL